MNKNVYNDNFFDNRGLSYASAKWVVPKLIDMFNPKSVVDVGCGTGTWLSVFLESGIEDVLGLDGDYVQRSKLNIPVDKFVGVDLTKFANDDLRKFDLAICLEVAEHLPLKKSDHLVALLTSFAPVIFFSAAIPGQGGDDHINEQWPDFWRDLFSKYDYQIFDIMRPMIWDLSEVEPWYAQNSFIYIHKESSHFSNAMKIASNFEFPLRAVHPELFRRFVGMEPFRLKQLIIEVIRRVLGKIGGNNQVG